MLQHTEVWSPDQELRLLEELAEVEEHSFELEMSLPVHPDPAERDRPWVAYWHLPPNGFRSRSSPFGPFTKGVGPVRDRSSHKNTRRLLTVSAMRTRGSFRSLAASVVGTASINCTSPDSRAAVRAPSLGMKR